MNYARPTKRSLTLSGHRTSVTLEEPFWRAFQMLAKARGLSINALAAQIDAARPGEVGLASAIRVHVLDAAVGGEVSAFGRHELEENPVCGAHGQLDDRFGPRPRR